jgi:peptidoglycan hydrolase-like protein with peptidoglycan-binding domain
MAKCFCFMSTGACSHTVPGLSTYVNIKQPVGVIEGHRQSGNRPDDVRAIQGLLNRIKPVDGGPASPLAVDGICGPLTRGAIKLFQRTQFPDVLPDTIVDPNYPTHYRLNTIVNPLGDGALIPAAKEAMAELATYIAKTIRTLDLIRDAWSHALPSPIFSREREIKVLNSHFHLDRSTNRLRDLALIRTVYRDMQVVCAHIPSGPNQRPAYGIFNVMPHDIKGQYPYAWTFAGGWRFNQGKAYKEKDRNINQDMDMIYLTQAILSGNPGNFKYVVCHELAHYVGGGDNDIDLVDDHAYFHKNPEKYKSLNTYDAITNADCYSQYNWEVNTGSRFHIR